MSQAAEYIADANAYFSVNNLKSYYGDSYIVQDVSFDIAEISGILKQPWLVFNWLPKIVESFQGSVLKRILIWPALKVKQAGNTSEFTRCFRDSKSVASKRVLRSLVVSSRC